jgi:branched-chain amino acid transport system permease protein
MVALRRIWPLLSLLALVTVVTGVVTLGPPDMDQAVTLALINVIVVVGIYAFVGLTGVFSFGSVAFMAIGAYVAGLLTVPVATKAILLPELPGFLATAHAGTVPSLIAGGIVAAVVAFVLALPLMRMVGLSAAIATLSVLMIVYVVGKNWHSITNGTTGMNAVPVTTTTWTALTWALLAIGAVYVFQQSRVGLRLRALRDEEIAARGAGIDVARSRTAAFVVSAFVMGVGGGVYGQYMGAFTPDAFYLQTTFITLVMLIIGGVRSLSGAVAGTIVVSFVQELLVRAESGSLGIPARPGVAAVGVSAILLAMLIWRPSGLTGGREITWPFGRVEPVGREPKEAG